MTRDVRRTGRSFVAVIWWLMVAPSTVAVHAQEITGTIYGRLTDQTGGVLPGVKVTVVSVETEQRRETVTNSVGRYSISLPIGRYTITFLLPDFRPYIAGGIELHVNDQLEVNANLKIGALVETLTVSAKRSVQRTSSVQGLIPQVAIQELPILNRTPVQLVTLVPGVSSDLREDACFCDQGNLDISINGARRSAVNWLLDGASNVNTWTNYTLVTTPSLEAIQEINVITSTYSAEWSRNGGGVVNAVTKSGGQRFSGSVYEFLRNDGLNANSFFRNMDPNPAINSGARRLRYNNFGYTVGGPMLPTRRGLFFFFSEDLRRSSRDKYQAESNVPDPLWLTDPNNANYVPPEARDPNAVKLLRLWPAPNVPGTNSYRTTVTNRLDTRQQFGRVDFFAGTNWSGTGRYLRDRVDSRGEYTVGPELSPGHRFLMGHLAVVDARRSGQRVLHEVSYHLSSHRRTRNDVLPTRTDFGIAIPELFPENRAQLVPSIWVSGLSIIDASQPRPREYLNHTLTSALTFTRGTHTLKTGGLIAREYLNANLHPESTSGVFFIVPGGGFSAFQNFLRGNANGACGACIYSETDIDVSNRFRTGRYELYVQDTWRAHPTVTFDLGLRYAFYPPIVDDNGMLFTFSPEAYDPAQAPPFADTAGRFISLETGNRLNGMLAAGRDSPFGSAIYPADTNNLQPRVGVAWDPGGSGRMIVRAGYGVYFDQTSVEMIAEGIEFSSFDPFRTDVLVANASLSNPTAHSTPLVWPKSRELLFPQSSSPSTVLTPQATATSDRLVSPRWQHWNIGIQRELYSGGVIDAGYVASRGDHLLRYIDINQPQPAELVGHGPVLNTVRPFPGYGTIVLRETTAKSRYNGMLVSLRHGSGHGLWATVNYTFSLNKADATYDNSILDDPQNQLQPDAEFGAARTDRTHIFNASYVYQLPFGRSGSAGWRNALFGGWQLSGITRIESGPAARVRVTNCSYGNRCFPGALRPNQVADPAAGDQEGLLWFDPAAFGLSAAGEYGTATVSPFRLPGRHQWDIAVSRVVRLPGSRRLQFRADLINAFNHTQFLDVNTSCVGTTTCGSSFGKVTSTRPAREIQLGVRFDW